jgi:outer membrane receptor protein involved in Fe transport
MKHHHVAIPDRWLSLALLILSATTMIAGTTGKIAGRALDKQTGEPLPSVNILLEGTTIGGSTNAEGWITIINVNPGTYVVRATSMGYTTQLITNVKISADLTTTLQFDMNESAIVLDKEVVIIAERPMINRDETSTMSVVSAETFANLPIAGFQQVVALQAGFVTDAGGEIHARGGRSGEVVYLVDGVPTRDPLTGGMGTQLDKYAIQELQVLTGGFSAEYGQALSGVVNIVTKEGGSNYSGRIEYESGQLNESPYHATDALAFDYMGLQENGVMTPRVDDKGRLIKDIPSAYRQQTMAETEDLFPEINMPGQISLMAGGPMPFLPQLRFFATARYGNALSQLPWGYNKERETNGKLSYMSGGVKISFSDRRLWRKYKTYTHTWKFVPGGIGERQETTLRDNLTLNYFPNNETNITLNLVYNSRLSSRYTPGRYAIFSSDGMLLESNYVKNTGNQFLQTGDLGDYSDNDLRTYIAKLDISTQVDRYNLIKAGTEVTSHNLKRFAYQQPWKGGFWAYENFRKYPVEIAAYVQDKLEFSSFIVNVGVRLDFVDVKDMQWPSVLSPGGFLDDSLKQWVVTNEIPAKSQLQISPRLGIAFPITEGTVFFSSYGHFFQRADYLEMYSLRDPSISNAFVGNPGIEPQKTVAFEFGVRQQLAEQYSIEVGAYFKDITNLVGSTYHTVFPYNYTIYDNSNYGKVNGVDVTLTRRMGDYFGGSLTYAYSVAKGNESDPTEGYTDFRGVNAILRPKRVFYLDFDRRHVLSGLVNIVFPERFGPLLLGFYPFENLNTNIVVQTASGLPYTPNYAEEGDQLIVEKNSARKGATYQVDLRVERWVPLFGLKVSAFLTVFNLFDTINPQLVWAATGDAWDAGVRSVNTPDRQRNPGNVDVRRRIQAGVRIDL